MSEIARRKQTFQTPLVSFSCALVIELSYLPILLKRRIRHFLIFRRTACHNRFSIPFSAKYHFCQMCNITYENFVFLSLTKKESVPSMVNHKNMLTVFYVYLLLSASLEYPCYYKYDNSFSAGIVFLRQNMTSTDVRF